MKRKLLIILTVLLFSFTGCGAEEMRVNVSNSENVSSNQFGKFVNIGNNLAYDSATRIVYVENYTYYSHCVYTPYYAPNGLPYRYNPETNTLEEIENSEVK